MPSDAESRIQRLLAERRPASSAASSYGASAGGYRAASSSSYSGYRGAASRPSSAPSYGSYKAASAAVEQSPVSKDMARGDGEGEGTALFRN